MLLLDTHVLVWYCEGIPELSDEGRALVDEAFATGVWASAISFWEIAMLEAKGRMVLSAPIRAWRDFVVSQGPVTVAPVTDEIGVEAACLPGFHPDPADRMIVATARHHRIPLVTRDRNILAYGASGHLDVIQV